MAFKRVCYSSEAVSAHTDHLAAILSQSVRNNAVQGITGVLVQHEHRYLQVIEGDERDIDALLQRLRRDTRHRQMKIHFSETTDMRLFDAWSMTQALLSGQQVNTVMRLLTSELPSSQEVGLTFLKYWLTTQEVNNTLNLEQAQPGIRHLENALYNKQSSRASAVVGCCVAILLALLIDATFFLFDYFDGIQGSAAMLQAYGAGTVGMVLAIWFAVHGKPDTGIEVFQAAAIATVAMHGLGAGYGINAPTLPYLGGAIMVGVLSKRRDRGRQIGLVSLLLVGTLALLSFSPATAVSFNQAVPQHHAAMAGLLFPLICLLILEAQKRDKSASEWFTAGVLMGLTDSVTSLQKAMTARNYFFSAISHEIRTPMNGAMSAVTLIEHPKASPEIKARSTQALRQSLSNLNRLLNDLLDISKLESGKFELTTAPFDVNAATRRVVEFFMPGVEQGGNTIALNLLPVSVVLSGDQQRYEQMLSNFLGNAIKFTRGGRITVSLQRLTASSEASVEAWRCEVCDSGIGVSSDEIEKLFKPFSQASQNGFSDTKGTGLGLAIVAALARQMSGEVGVDSVEGQGSTFWFTFQMPIHAPAMA